MEIQEMILRIPGLSERESRLLAEEVSQGLVEGIGVGERGGNLGDIDLQLQITGALSRQQLARQIIQAIIQKLQ